jgi:PKD repeat protein
MRNKQKYSVTLTSTAMFLVLLIITSSTASAATLSLKSPIAAFSASPISGEAPLKVKFTDKSTGSPTSWKWSFGDGKYSTTKNPIHVYSKEGIYSVTLTVKNARGSNTVKNPDYISVQKSQTLKITSPLNGATVNIQETVKGTAKNIPKGYKIWILVYPHPANRYYPQSGKLTLQKGKWSIPVYIGVKENVGDKFDILAVLANKKASDKFTEYIKTGEKTNSWPGMVEIPVGAKAYDKITVTRA